MARCRHIPTYEEADISEVACGVMLVIQNKLSVIKIEVESNKEETIVGYKTVMIIKAVVCLVFGIILLSAPDALFRFLGAALSPGGVFAAREYAATLFGNLTLAWMARNAADSDARRAIILALFCYDGIAFVASFIAMLYGVLNPLGWLVVFVYLFFTWGFGNLLRVRASAA
jgi:hypothetical protein